MAWKLKVNGQETTTINDYTVKNIVNKGKTYNFDRPEQTGTTTFEFSSLSAESYLGIYKTTNTPIEIYVGDTLNTTITDIGMYEVNLTGTSISSTVTVKIIGGEFCCGGVDSPGPGLFYRKNGIQTNSIFSISKIVLGSNYVDVMPAHMFKTLNVNSENMEISIPDGVSLIYVDTYTFGGAISQDGLKSQYFKSISINENNPIYDSRDNCNAIIETATNKLISGCNTSTFTVPNTVTSIANGSFYSCDQLTSITLPEGLESIESASFAYCSLTELTIPSTIKNIEPGAFKSCKSLTKITVASNNPIYDSRDNCNAIIETATNNLITGCNTSTFTIPNTVTSIEDYAFYYCDQLTDIILSDKIKSIGKAAFYCCNKLTSITLPEGLESIGNSAFSNCSSFTGRLNIPSTVKSIGSQAFNSCASLTGVPMPEGLQSIGKEAFYGAFNISSINIPSTVTNIGYRAFRDCRFLDKLTVASNNPIYDSRDNCNAIIETATNTLLFGANETIIPNTVTTIGEYAFDTRLDFPDVGLNIPEGVQIIESYAFFDCDFTSVTIHSTVKTIKHNAFESCSRLETVILSEGLESIEDKAFLADNTLKKITIPSTVTYIGALVWCNSLTNALNLTEITFNHSETDSLTLHPEIFGPITTSSVKSAKALTVYHYGNPTVLNHNYAGANITPTFVDLREQQ